MAKYKYGVSKVIKHPQGTYKVAYRDSKRSLGNSVLLWFKNKRGQFVPRESDKWHRKELKRLMIK